MAVGVYTAAVRPSAMLLPYFAFSVSLVATAGSLFFSEVMKLPPCVLCWYQRIFMFPLALLLPIAILSHETRMRRYFLPLATLGFGVATFHVLLYYGVIPESIKPCTAGVSCTSRQIEWLGFITIPLLSWVAFLLVGVSLMLHGQKEKVSP